MMKRRFVLVMISLFLLSFAACHKANSTDKPSSSEVQTETQTDQVKKVDGDDAVLAAQKPVETDQQDKAELEAKDNADKTEKEVQPDAEIKPEANVIKPNENFNLKTPIPGLKPGEKCEIPDGFCEELMEEGATLIAWRKIFKRTATGEATDEEIEKLIPQFIPKHEPKNVRYTLNDVLSEELKHPFWSVAFETGSNEDTRLVKASVVADEHYLYAYIISRHEFSSIEDMTVTNALLKLSF